MSEFDISSILKSVKLQHQFHANREKDIVFFATNQMHGRRNHLGVNMNANKNFKCAFMVCFMKIRNRERNISSEFKQTTKM